MPRFFVFFLLLPCLCFSVPAAAEDKPELTDIPPPLPENTEETLEPGVTIVQGEKALVKEYRRNGVVYMLKVIPDVGPAYYLIDTDGDGSLETTQTDWNAPLPVPQWILFSW